jgi:hypothetical protein
MVESYGKNGNVQSLRQRIYDLLDKNPYFTAKGICEKLDLQYKQHANYITKTKSEWKSYRQKEQGSTCSSVHGWWGSCFISYFVSRESAIEVGWERTKAKNRWLLWRDKVGRMMWFENGRVNVYVRPPANMGRVKQLISNGFYKTGLIYEVKSLEQVFETFKFNGAHYVFDIGQRLPKKTIDAFAKSHGITIKIGDKSHPKGVEILMNSPNWAERNELLLERLTDLFVGGETQRSSLKKPDYVV